jgi:hypothetical protein
MDPEYLNMYVGFIMWLTVMLSGSRLEIFFVVYVLHNAWNRNKELLEAVSNDAPGACHYDPQGKCT